MPTPKYVTEQPVYFSADGKKLFRFIEKDKKLIAESAELPEHENAEGYNLRNLDFADDESKEWTVYDHKGKALHISIENNQLTCLFNRSDNLGVVSKSYSDGVWKSTPSRKRINSDDLKESPVFNGFSAADINAFFEQQQKIQQAWENHWRAELEQKHDSFVRSAEPDQEIAALTGELERNLNEILEYHHIVPSKFSDAAEAEYFLSAIVEYFETIRNSTNEQLEDDKDLIKLNKVCNEIYNFCCRTVDDEAFFTAQGLPMPGLLWLKKTDYTLRTLEAALHFARTGNWNFTPSKPGERYVRKLDNPAAKLDSDNRILLHATLDMHIATIQNFQFPGIDDHIKNVYLEKAINEDCNTFNESLDVLYGYCSNDVQALNFIRAFKMVNDITFNNKYLKNGVVSNYASDSFRADASLIKHETINYVTDQRNKKFQRDEKYEDEKILSEEKFDPRWRKKLSSVPEKQYKFMRKQPLAEAFKSVFTSQEATRELINHGADVNAVDFETGLSMVELAISKNKFRSLDYLLKAGAKMPRSALEKMLSFNCLEDYQCLDVLVRNGMVDINERDEKGKTVLHRSIAKYNFHFGIKELLELFLDHNADLTLFDNDGNTVLHYVFSGAIDEKILSSKSSKEFDMLLEKTPVQVLSKTNKDGKTPVRLAMKYSLDYLPELAKKLGVDFSRRVMNKRQWNTLEKLFIALTDNYHDHIQGYQISCMYTFIKSENLNALNAMFSGCEKNSSVKEALMDWAKIIIEEEKEGNNRVLFGFLCRKIISEQSDLQSLLACAVKHENLDAIRIFVSFGAKPEPEISARTSDAVINALIDGAILKDRKEAEAKGEMKYPEEDLRAKAAWHAEEEKARLQYRAKFEKERGKEKEEKAGEEKEIARNEKEIISDKRYEAILERKKINGHIHFFEKTLIPHLEAHSKSRDRITQAYATLGVMKVFKSILEKHFTLDSKYEFLESQKEDIKKFFRAEYHYHKTHRGDDGLWGIGKLFQAAESNSCIMIREYMEKNGLGPPEVDEPEHQSRKENK